MGTVIDWNEWPEGAELWLPNQPGTAQCVVRFSEDGTVWFSYSKTCPWTMWVAESKSSILDRFKYKSKGWDGEGLPPVGTVCEFATYHGGDPVWKECKIIAHDDGFAVIAYKGNYSGQSNNHLRPIRTPEQIEAEERKAAIDAMYYVFKAAPGLSAKEGFAAIYDAGYRKQVKP